MFLEQLSLSGSPVTYSPPEQTRPICPNNPVCVVAQGRCCTVGLEPAQVFPQLKETKGISLFQLANN